MMFELVLYVEGLCPSNLLLPYLPTNDRREKIPDNVDGDGVFGLVVPSTKNHYLNVVVSIPNAQRSSKLHLDHFGMVT